MHVYEHISPNRDTLGRVFQLSHTPVDRNCCHFAVCSRWAQQSLYMIQRSLTKDKNCSSYLEILFPKWKYTCNLWDKQCILLSSSEEIRGKCRTWTGPGVVRVTHSLSTLLSQSALLAALLKIALYFRLIILKGKHHEPVAIRRPGCNCYGGRRWVG